MVNDEQMRSELKSFCAPKKGYSSRGTLWFLAGSKRIRLYTISR